MRQMAVVCLIGWFSALSIVAQEPKNAKAHFKRSNFDPNLVQVQFRDGSHLKMTLLNDSVEVMTKYGKVSVPGSDMRRIEFGLRIPAETLERVDAAVAKLDDTRRFESAKSELVRIGEFAVPSVRNAARKPDAVAARTVLNELKQSLPGDHFEARLYDTIYAAEFPLSGKVEAALFRARSPYFGDVVLRLDEVRTIRWLAAPERNEITVDAANYGTAAQLWLDSGIDIGDFTRISATGIVDLYPLGGEKGVYLATPNGNARVGRQTTFPAGSLLGRIGTDGKPFLVGEKYEGSPGRGRLYLRVEIGPWQVQPFGSYTARIGTDR